MKIRKYHPDDQLAVLNLMSLNIPQFFDESEKKDLQIYLKEEVEDYFVVVEKNRIIGAGGINYFSKDRKARIAWDFIDPICQGKGIGTKLLKHRIDHIKNQKEIETIIVRTSQLAFKFYEKNNFNLIEIEKDYWAEGFDLYLMEIKIT